MSNQKYFLLLLLMAVTTEQAYSQTDSLAVTPPLVDTANQMIHDFSVIEKDNKAILRWKADSMVALESFYAIERSSNGKDFNLVGITKTVGRGWFEFADESPLRGKIFYRVKLSAGQSVFYSTVITANSLAVETCRFYPNPVDKVLIVRSELSMELQISDNTGKPVITDKFSAGLKVVDVSALEPGIYVITLFQKETGRQLTSKLVKK